MRQISGFGKTRAVKRGVPIVPFKWDYARAIWRSWLCMSQQRAKLGCCLSVRHPRNPGDVVMRGVPTELFKGDYARDTVRGLPLPKNVASKDARILY
mmetsp:Transcript_33168/g.80229  ORF Transcript_33168/g.80229 Transcript_33168/m.80229 type:complete len:97 (+) Transcript_33168:2581-2871(+)